eukprot:6176983-Pleurochrysis_carterae.AAC.1
MPRYTSQHDYYSIYALVIVPASGCSSSCTLPNRAQRAISLHRVHADVSIHHARRFCELFNRSR